MGGVLPVKGFVVCLDDGSVGSLVYCLGVGFVVWVFWGFSICCWLWVCFWVCCFICLYLLVFGWVFCDVFCCGLEGR